MNGMGGVVHEAAGGSVICQRPSTHSEVQGRSQREASKVHERGATQSAPAAGILSGHTLSMEQAETASVPASAAGAASTIAVVVHPEITITHPRIESPRTEGRPAHPRNQDPTDAARDMRWIVHGVARRINPGPAAAGRLSPWRGLGAR